MKQSSIPVTSEVRRLGDVPTLFINGQAIPGTAYITYFTDRNRYADFAKAGIRLFTMPVFFARRTINEVNNFPLFGEGIFETEIPDFSIFDREIQRILEVCPDAKVFPRVNMNTTKAWDEAHPEELCDTGYIDRRACFSSDAWMDEVKRMLGLFIDHIQNSAFAASVIGYQIAAGNTEEWFSFDQRGSQGRRSREKFARYCAEHQITGDAAKDGSPEYYSFLSEIAAERICDLAAFAKERTEHRLVVGSFYGYTLECPFRTSNHHALRRVLESPDVDFLCSPVSYTEGRRAGRDIPNILPIDSVKHHGKLYYAENDIRTDLTTFCCDNPKYRTPIWLGYERPVTLEIMKLVSARQLTHGHASWWFDMWGGWYAAPEYMSFIADFRKLLESSLSLPSGSSSKAVVVIDEKAYSGIDGSAGFCSAIRESLGKCAVPYDIYLASDGGYAISSRRYSALVILDPARTDTVNSLIALAAEENLKTLVINEDNAGISPTELRSFFSESGITPVCPCDAVVFENASFLFIHAPVDGVYPVNRDFSFTDAFTGQEITAPLKLKACTGILLRKTCGNSPHSGH